MPKPRTHYQVLGIPREADENAVRAAYRALMKQHHPDRVGGSAAWPPLDEPAGGAYARSPRGSETDRVSRAAELNAAFYALRDPGRRARYDAELRFTDARGVPPEPRAPPRPTYSGPKTGVYGAVALAVVSLGAVWAGLLVNTSNGPNAHSVARGHATSGVATSDVAVNGMAADGSRAVPAARLSDERLGPSPVPVDRAQAEAGRAEFTRVFAGGGLAAAAKYSELCFEEQARTRRADDLDFCIAFDRAAFLRATAPLSATIARPSRFQVGSIEARHAAALRLVQRERTAAISFDSAMVGIDAVRPVAITPRSAPAPAPNPAPNPAPTPTPTPTPTRAPAPVRASVPGPPVVRRTSPVPRSHARPSARPVRSASVPATHSQPRPQPRPQPRSQPRAPTPDDDAPRDIRIGPQ